MTAVPALECRDLAVGRAATPVIAGIELAVRAGGLLALLGASGSGKTTLIDTVAGFVPPLHGTVLMAGHTVSSAEHCEPPERRSIGVVFQHYALWPHLSVLDIVAYPARRDGLGRSAARSQAQDLLERLDIAALADRRPAGLSGGEQQRVALARALARRPALFLFDEPTAHLDAHLRGVVLDEIARRRTESLAAAVYATHDAAEALAIADSVAVIDGGRVVQCGSPREVYEQPVSLAAARLTGPASVLSAGAGAAAAADIVTSASPASVTLTIGGVTADVACACASPLQLPPLLPLLLRPDWVEFGGAFSGVVAAVRFRGPHTDYTLDTAAGQLHARRPGPPCAGAGERVAWSLSRVWPLPGPTDGRPARVAPRANADILQ